MGLTKRVNLAQLFDEEFSTDNDAELVLAHDALAASCASYRMWRQRPLIRWRSLESMIPNAKDIDSAEKIRRFYRDRYTVKMLRGLALTPFQTDVFEVIEQRRLQNRHLGLLYRLPYLYMEDCAREEIQAWYQEHGNKHSLEHPEYVPAVDLCVRPYRDILRSRRSGEQWEFWWLTEQQELAMMACSASNELLGLIRSLFDRGEPMRIGGRAYVKQNKHMPGILYWHLQGMELR